MFKKVFFGVTGFCIGLIILFIILKLTGAVDWKWVFVLMPIIVYFVLLLLFCIMSILILASEDDDYYKEREND